MVIDEDELLDALRTVDEQLGDGERLTVGAYRSYRRQHDADLPSARTIYERWGGWDDALRAAGLDVDGAASD